MTRIERVVACHFRTSSQKRDLTSPFRPADRSLRKWPLLANFSRSYSTQTNLDSEQYGRGSPPLSPLSIFHLLPPRVSTSSLFNSTLLLLLLLLTRTSHPLKSPKIIQEANALVFVVLFLPGLSRFGLWERFFNFFICSFVGIGRNVIDGFWERRSTSCSFSSWRSCHWWSRRHAWNRLRIKI